MFQSVSRSARFRQGVCFIAVSFALNLAWEMSQAFLYAPHFSGPTEYVRIHVVAACADVMIVGVIVVAADVVSGMGRGTRLTRAVAASLVGLVVSIAIERFALTAGLWSYGVHMPLVPFFGVGIVPVLQMMLIPALVIRLCFPVVRDRPPV